MTPQEYEWFDEQIAKELNRLITAHPDRWAAAKDQPKAALWFCEQIRRNLAVKNDGDLVDRAVRQRRLEQ